MRIKFPKISWYTKYFDETKYMNFLIKDRELLEAYNMMWERVSKLIKTRFESEPLYNEEYLKTNTKSYDGKIFMKKKKNEYIVFVY